MGACGALGFSLKQETGITRTGTVRRRKAGQSSSLLTFVYWRWWMAWMPLFVCKHKKRGRKADFATTWNGWTVLRTYRAGAPHSGAVPVRRTSVLGRWPKTLAEGEFISHEHCNQKGGAALRAAKPKKKDTPGRVLLFGTSQHYRCQ